MSSNKIYVFRADFKTKMAARCVIGLAIYELFSANDEQNSTTLDRKQYINVLYQVYVFRADRKNKNATPACDQLRLFQILLSNR